MKNQQLESFFKKLNNFVSNNELIRLVVSNKRNKRADLKNIIITIAQLKAGYRLNFIYRYDTKDITKFSRIGSMGGFVTCANNCLK